MPTHIPHVYTTPKWQARVIPLDKHFYFADSTAVSNLWELKQALNFVSDETLSHHTSSDKHDIADWVEHVIGDPQLASALRKSTHRWGLIVALERQLMRTLNLPPYVASRWLSPAKSTLFLASGEQANTLEDLADILKSTSDETISFHLERYPNDIAQWVMLDIGDYDLAELLTESSNRLQMHRFVADHVDMLKEAAHE